MAKLFEALKMKGVTFKNRIMIPPMCTYAAPNFVVEPFHLVHYATRAQGGAGSIVVEATAVQPDGRISTSDLGLWCDEQIEGMARLATHIREFGSVPGIQLAHAGRKGSNWVNGGRERILRGFDEAGWPLMAPSAIPLTPEHETPREMTKRDIKEVQDDFVAATVRALQAGYDFVQIHAAHGYLIAEFLSPITNQRSDEYGGSKENRARFLLELLEKIKPIYPDDKPLSVRISATNWVEGDVTLEESIWLALQMADRGVDIIDVSTGGLLPHAKIPLAPGYQVPYANAIKRAVGDRAKVVTVGLITNASQAETILQQDSADFVAFGRETLRNPYFPIQAAKELGAEIEIPWRYKRAFM